MNIVLLVENWTLGLVTWEEGSISCSNTHFSWDIEKSLLALQMCSAAASHDQIIKVLKSFENLAIYFVAE